MSEVYEPVGMFSQERAEVLAKLIEGLPHAPAGVDEGFNMQRFAHSCGTPSCIAGWAASLLKRRPTACSSCIDLEEFLGCTFDQAKWLAYGRFSPLKQMYQITPAEAAEAIRKLAECIERGQDVVEFVKF